MFATKPFRAGERIPSFQGRVVHREDLASLTAWEREHLGELTAETYQVLPEPRCYLNHACAPTAVSTPDAVYAQRNIAVGEEITVDYRLNAHDDGDVWEMTCRCEAFPSEHVVRCDFFFPPSRCAGAVPAGCACVYPGGVPSAPESLSRLEDVVRAAGISEPQLRRV